MNQLIEVPRLEDLLDLSSLEESFTSAASHNHLLVMDTGAFNIPLNIDHGLRHLQGLASLYDQQLFILQPHIEYGEFLGMILDRYSPWAVTPSVYDELQRWHNKAHEEVHRLVKDKVTFHRLEDHERHQRRRRWERRKRHDVSLREEVALGVLQDYLNMVDSLVFRARTHRLRSSTEQNEHFAAVYELNKTLHIERFKSPALEHKPAYFVSNADVSLVASALSICAHIGRETIEIISQDADPTNLMYAVSQLVTPSSFDSPIPSFFRLFGGHITISSLTPYGHFRPDYTYGKAADYLSKSDGELTPRFRALRHAVDEVPDHVRRRFSRLYSLDFSVTQPAA